MQFYSVLSLTAKKVPQRNSRRSNFIRTSIVTFDFKPANSLRSDNAGFVVVSLTLMAHYVRRRFYCVIVRICTASVWRSHDSERKRFGAAELKRTSERSEDVVNISVFSLSLPKISFFNFTLMLVVLSTGFSHLPPSKIKERRKKALKKKLKKWKI